jgi:hypothetical protein
MVAVMVAARALTLKQAAPRMLHTMFSQVGMGVAYATAYAMSMEACMLCMVAVVFAASASPPVVCILASIVIWPAHSLFCPYCCLCSVLRRRQSHMHTAIAASALHAFNVTCSPFVLPSVCVEAHEVSLSSHMPPS